jgi:hypothetical protein
MHRSLALNHSCTPYEAHAGIAFITLNNQNDYCFVFCPICFPLSHISKHATTIENNRIGPAIMQIKKSDGLNKTMAIAVPKSNIIVIINK